MVMTVYSQSQVSDLVFTLTEDSDVTIKAFHLLGLCPVEPSTRGRALFNCIN